MRNAEGMLTPVQGEFETSREFQERSAKLKAAVNGFGEVIVCEKLSGLDDSDFRYDADGNQFNGSIPFGHTVLQDTKSLGSYRSQTRMGVRMTVHASSEANYDLFISRNALAHSSGCRSEYGHIVFSVPFSRESAPGLKMSGYLAIIGQFELPYVTTSENPGQATLDDPYEVYRITTSVHMQPRRMVLIDNGGKEVWACEQQDAPVLTVGSAAPSEHKNSPEAAVLNSALARLERNPKDVDALIDAGNAALAMGDVDVAVGFLAKADQITPNNLRVRAGLAAALVQNGNPYDAIPLFTEAEGAGAMDPRLNADRGLAYDLVGDNATAQKYYRLALASSPSDEVKRRLALSFAIGGNRAGMEEVLMPLLQKADKPAYRTRALALAILGKPDEAVTIAYQTMPQDLAAGISPYLRYMPRLTKAQQAAAVTFGRFPRAADIGRDDPLTKEYAVSSDTAAPRKLLPANGDIIGPLRHAQRDAVPVTRIGDEEYLQLFKSWMKLDRP